MDKFNEFYEYWLAITDNDKEIARIYAIAEYAISDLPISDIVDELSADEIKSFNYERKNANEFKKANKGEAIDLDYRD